MARGSSRSASRGANVGPPLCPGRNQNLFSIQSSKRLGFEKVKLKIGRRGKTHGTVGKGCKRVQKRRRGVSASFQISKVTTKKAGLPFHAQRVRCLLFGSLLWLSVGLYQAFAK